MKLKFLSMFKPRKPSVKEKGDYYFKCDKGKYFIDYEITTDKDQLFKYFDLIKNKLPGFKQKEGETVFKEGKEIVIEPLVLPKIEKAIVTALNPNKVFAEVKKELPTFKHYNIKLAYASIKPIEENLFFMKIKLEGLCDE